MSCQFTKFLVKQKLIKVTLTVVAPIPKARISVTEVTRMDTPACLSSFPILWVKGKSSSW